jgi:hypothetical protein
METDPLDHFEQQLESHELIQTHRATLIADACEVLRQQPDAGIAALIMRPDAGDQQDFRRQITQASGRRALPAGGMVGIVPRAWVRLLEQMAPHLPPVEPEPLEHRLPVLVSTRDGRRLGMYVFTLDGA